MSFDAFGLTVNISICLFSFLLQKEADGDGVAENGNSEGSSVKKVRTEENNGNGVDSSEAAATN